HTSSTVHLPNSLCLTTSHSSSSTGGLETDDLFQRSYLFISSAGISSKNLDASLYLVCHRCLRQFA
ncbi:MAG: hypothetical protein ACOZBL_02275, partial [Patescibacteria group bacterium]